jgi:hypothetical protein
MAKTDMDLLMDDTQSSGSETKPDDALSKNTESLDCISSKEEQLPTTAKLQLDSESQSDPLGMS